MDIRSGFDAFFVLFALFCVALSGAFMVSVALHEARQGWKEYKSEKERLGKW